jgi:hypothetical protein
MAVHFTRNLHLVFCEQGDAVDILKLADGISETLTGGFRKD